jgi:hypothetical protein
MELDESPQNKTHKIEGYSVLMHHSAINEAKNGKRQIAIASRLIKQ